MYKYDIEQTLGEGAFGAVYKAKNKQTNETVAIKYIKKKFRSWDECMQLKELTSLKKLKNHPNLVDLKELLLERAQQALYFVFEFVPCDLCKVIQTKVLSPSRIRGVFQDLLRGLAHMHRQGFFHRECTQYASQLLAVLHKNVAAS